MPSYLFIRVVLLRLRDNVITICFCSYTHDQLEGITGMRANVFIIGLIVASSLCTSALAAEDCKNPQSQLALNTCAARDYEREDARLNRNYRELVAKLDAERKSQLKEVQLAWIKFRDLQCEYDSTQYQGGTIYSLVHSACLLQMTKQRNKDLKAMIEDASL